MDSDHLQTKWDCTACTYENVTNRIRCAMCEAHRAPLQSSKQQFFVDLTTTDEGNRLHLVGNESSTLQYASMESTRRKKRAKKDNGRSDILTTKKKKKHAVATTSRKQSSITIDDESCDTKDSSEVRKLNLAPIDESQSNELLHRCASSDRKEKNQATLFDSGVIKERRTKTSSQSHQNQIRNERTKSVSTRLKDGDNKRTKQMDEQRMMPGKKSQRNQLPLAISQNQLKVPIKTTSEVEFCHFYKQSQQIMKATFSISSLRNLQPQAIRLALRRKSQIIVMATGGGKSLCYQLPACVLPGVTIVVSPLIALMHDQVQNLCKKGVEAASFSSAESGKNKEVLQRLLLGYTQHNNLAQQKPIKVFYCTPELIQTDRFQSILLQLYKKGSLAMFAVDEAHCLSTWGHDFRPAYRKLSWLRSSFPDVPCMACTATATAKVISDIRDVLNMNNGEECHKSTFNRPNIHYEVRYKDSMTKDAIEDLIHFIKKEHKAAHSANALCSGIIYVHKRNDTSFLTSKLNEAGIIAGPYHAGLNDTIRKKVQQQWTDGSIKVAVATVAFGMGIDLPHCRYVVHWCMSKTVEGFYQESGRCGRDGLPAKSLLYYSKDDASKFAFIMRKASERKETNGTKTGSTSSDTERSLEALRKMKDYCTKLCCRRQFLLSHFGEKSSDPKKLCKMTCDYCESPRRVESAMDSCNTARIVREVKQKIAISSRKTNKSEGHWGEPHGHTYCGEGDEEFNDEISHSQYGDRLGISHTSNPATIQSDDKSFQSGFKKAREILLHYEALECKSGQDNGFVTFKSKKSNIKGKSLNKDKRIYGDIPQKSNTAVPRPVHIMREIQQLKSRQNIATDAVNRKLDACEVAKNVCTSIQLKAEIDMLKQQKLMVTAKLAKMQEGNKNSKLTSLPPPPPPPSLSFCRSRKRR